MEDNLRFWLVLDLLAVLKAAQINNRFLRKRGIPGFSLHFPKELSLGLKEMGKFLWEGREKGV